MIKIGKGLRETCLEGVFRGKVHLNLNRTKTHSQRQYSIKYLLKEDYNKVREYSDCCLLLNPTFHVLENARQKVLKSTKDVHAWLIGDVVASGSEAKNITEDLGLLEACVPFGYDPYKTSEFKLIPGSYRLPASKESCQALESVYKGKVAVFFPLGAMVYL